MADSLGLANATAKNLVSALRIPTNVCIIFLHSVPASLKSALLRSARLLVYTPANEHFGIVPLEAMRAGVPVLAADSGGPRETVVDGRTGWLRDPTRVDDWKAVLRNVVVDMSDEEVEAIGKNGVERVKAEFSREEMISRLDEEIEAMVGRPRKAAQLNMNILFGVAMFGAAIMAAMAILWKVRS